MFHTPGADDVQRCLLTSAIVFCLICFDKRHRVFCSFKIPGLENKPVNYRLVFCSMTVNYVPVFTSPGGKQDTRDESHMMRHSDGCAVMTEQRCNGEAGLPVGLPSGLRDAGGELCRDQPGKGHGS